MMHTAPAAIEINKKVTPRGSWTENETLPMDQVVRSLCEKIKQFQEMNTIMEV